MGIEELMTMLDSQAKALDEMSFETDLADFGVTFEAISQTASSIWQLFPQDFVLSVAFYAIQDAQKRYLNDALAGSQEAFEGIKAIVKQQVNLLLE